MSKSDTYDYIVVGAGSSGCVAANRLVTEHGVKVLLLEAGPRDKSMLLRWPAGAFKIILGIPPTRLALRPSLRSTLKAGL